MKVEYSDKFLSAEPSIFLAGPTSRACGLTEWRQTALNFLAFYKFNGTVYVPENSNDEQYDYNIQVEWEREHLNKSTVILFWVPREIHTLPGFTTNVEFGYWMAKYPKKCIYGRPDNAENTRYLDWLYTEETGRKPIKFLSELVTGAIELAEELSK